MKACVDIRIAEPDWSERIPGVRARCRDAVRAALDELGAVCSPDGIAILLTGDSEMSRLNAAWRGVDRPTNVLSLATGSDPGAEAVSGDIALAFGTVAREAASGGVRIEDRLAHLLVHGVMHLAGHDHRQDDEAERMEALEAGALGRIGIGDPYRARNSMEVVG